ncbi:hypothetical protein L0F63_004292 [Massospora cicadina]|nr:hypothetical protein L0F63_004292 [Massospora cicadina]
MKDYNHHSSFQAQANVSSCGILKEQAIELSKIFNKEFHLADFGCSHGKNSMECVKAAFDGYASTPESIQVYLNDLPGNDFGEVFRCLNDPTISYNEHPLAKNTQISTYVNGKSFYLPCLLKDHLHLSFTFNCLHWLETPVPLSRALFGSSDRTTPEEAKTLKEEAHDQLVRFLTYRADELQAGGRLVATTGIRYFEDLWEAYVASTGHKLDSFTNVVIPTYNRSDSEVQAALDQVKVEGLKRSDTFGDAEECEHYIDGFFHFAASDPPTHIIDFHILIVEKLRV